jgi:hypothetical protein
VKAQSLMPELKAYLNPEEVEKLTASACSLSDRLLVRLLFRLGCWMSEALGVQYVDSVRGSAFWLCAHLAPPYISISRLALRKLPHM